MKKQKNPGQRGRAAGNSALPHEQGEPYHSGNQPRNIWDAIRATLTNDADREAFAAARLEAAARSWGFTKRKDGDWVWKCKHCRGGVLGLHANLNGDIEAWSNNGCSAVAIIEEWLLREGYRS